MKKYLNNYIKEIDDLINTNKINKQIIEKHLIKIGFFQHERFIHLIVTVFYALLAIICLGISIFNNMFIFIAIILIAFLISYVLHYFFLENNVQYLYKQYDKMIK